MERFFSDYCGQCKLIDAIRDAVIVLDHDGLIGVWNAAASAIMGLEAGEVLGRRLNELGLELVDEALAPVAETTFLIPPNLSLIKSTWGLRKPDGTLSWLSVHMQPFEHQGAIGGVVVLLRDITDFKRTNDALRESEEKFRVVAEALSAAFGIVCGTRFVYANRYFAILSGYSVEELLTKDFPDLVHPDFRELMLERALRRQKGEAVPPRYEFKMITKSGEPRWVDFSVARTIYKGQPAIIGTGFDITDRKNAEETLRESEAKLKAFLDNSPLLMGVVDLLPDNSDTIHIYDNPAACSFLGLPNGATSNRRSSELGIPRETFRAWVERYRDSERLKEPIHFEYKDYRKGSAAWAEVTIVFIGPSANGCSRFIYMAQDITRRREEQEEIKTAKAAAERANAAKDQFLAVLSHELRTPLTPVLGGVSLMERGGNLSPEFKQTCEMIRRNVTLEAHLIDDLLDLTRISRGKITVTRKTMDLSEAARRALQISREDLAGRRLTLDAVIPEEPLLVEGDVARLQQVIWNLLKNAIKFTPDGGSIKITAYRSGGDVVIDVQDTGVGIAEDDLRRIFEPFEQGDGERPTRLTGGLGLGLAISKRLVDMHGGRISAQSEGKGRGALFRVVLPAARAGETVEEPRRYESPATGQGKAVLIVEDHQDTALMLKTMLKSFGYVVETAGSVDQALDIVADRKFDLLISDLGLPDRSGLELMRDLNKSGSSIKGIALSGYGSDDDVRKSKEAGFLEHVTKPVNMDVLIGAVERVI